MRSTSLLFLWTLLVVVACQESVTPPPARPAAIAIVSGNLQVGVVGSQLSDPLVVRVNTLDGSVVANAAVRFIVGGGNGILFQDSVLTDALGLAANRWQLGSSTADSQSVTAFVRNASGDTLRVRFGATARAGDPDTLIKVAGDAQEALFGALVPESLVVRVLDHFGNPVPGHPILWSVRLGGGTISPSASLSDAVGLAKSAWTLGGVALNAAEGRSDSLGIHHVGFVATAGRIIWRHAKGVWTWSSPAIGPDGTVYYGARDSAIRAVHPDGTLRWSYRVADGILDDGPSLGLNGDLYFATYPGAAVYALTSAGALKWRFATAAPVRGTPAVGTDGTVYALSLAGLYAIDSSGAERWFHAIAGASDDSPVIGPDGTVFVPVAMRGRLYALTPKDSIRWVVSFPGDTVNNDLGTPAIGPDGTVYVLAQDKQLYAVDTAGAIKWSVALGTATVGAKAAPAIAANGEVVVGGFGNGVWAVSPDGVVQWTSAAFTSQIVLGTPALTADGTIYFVDVNAVLYAVTGSGGLLWTQPINGQTSASPAVGSDGTVYIGSSSGGLAAILGSSPLATGGWPMFMHDLSHSGRQP